MCVLEFSECLLKLFMEFVRRGARLKNIKYSQLSLPTNPHFYLLEIYQTTLLAKGHYLKNYFQLGQHQMTRLMFSYQLRTLNGFVDFKIFLLFFLFICETFFCNLLPDCRGNNCLILFEYLGNNTQMSTITQNLCSVRSFLIRLKLLEN